MYRSAMPRVESNPELWVVSGILAGWLTDLVMTGQGYGLAGDLIVGLIGGLVGGWILGRSGASGVLLGWPGHILVAVLGGIVFVVAIRLLRRI